MYNMHRDVELLGMWYMVKAAANVFFVYIGGPGPSDTDIRKLKWKLFVRAKPPGGIQRENYGRYTRIYARIQVQVTGI